MQLPHFNSYGMYNEAGNPLSYDLFSRHYLTVMLHRGYRSFAYSTYSDLLWKGVQSWQFADDAVKEKPCPADLGGFALITPGFHKLFANAGGTYIEYDTNGDYKYNPTGLIRIHLKDGHSQLGPSDGCASLYSGAGINYAVGPAWKDAKGNWTKLADLSTTPDVEVLQESPDQTKLTLTYMLKDSDRSLTELITVKPDQVIIEDSISGKGIEQLRVYYPMLVFNGKDKTKIQMGQKRLRMQLEKKSVNFEILNSDESKLVRTGQTLKHRNGLVEPLYFDVDGQSAKYRIYTDK